MALVDQNHPPDFGRSLASSREIVQAIIWAVVQRMLLSSLCFA